MTYSKKRSKKGITKRGTLIRRGRKFIDSKGNIRKPREKDFFDDLF